MEQRNTSGTEQIRINSGCEVSGIKHRLSAADHGCSICRGTGWMRVDTPYGDPFFGKSTSCSCMQERQKLLLQRELRQAANLEAFSDCTFKTFNYRIPGVQEAVRLSVTYSTHPQGWLLFVGPCGCGKTHLAAAIANQRLDSDEAVFFTTVPDFLDMLRAALASPERYTRFYTWVREVDLLVLDDLGAQQPSAWSNEKLLQLLDYRATLALPTIITAIPQEFQGIDERLRSRLTDSQLVTTVIFEQAKDFRPLKLASRRKT
jgi:DNA replication protein DnaC